MNLQLLFSPPFVSALWKHPLSLFTFLSHLAAVTNAQHHRHRRAQQRKRLRPCFSSCRLLSMAGKINKLQRKLGHHPGDPRTHVTDHTAQLHYTTTSNQPPSTHPHHPWSQLHLRQLWQWNVAEAFYFHWFLLRGQRWAAGWRSRLTAGAVREEVGGACSGECTPLETPSCDLPVRSEVHWGLCTTSDSAKKKEKETWVELWFHVISNNFAKVKGQIIFHDFTQAHLSILKWWQ